MLSNIRLQQFKCYEQRVDAPLAMFNILYGKNGRGKSSLVQSILLLSQTLKEQGSVDYLHLNGIYARLGSFTDVVTRSQQNYSSFSIDIEAENEDMRMIFSQDTHKPTLAKLSDIKNGNNPLMSKMGEKDSVSHNDGNNYGVPTQSALQSFAYLKRVRFISANRPGPKNSEVRHDQNDEYLLSPNADNLFNVLASLSEETQNEIEQGLSYILSGATLDIRPKTDVIEVFMDSIDGTQGFKPVNVGYGYSYVLPIILQIVTAPANTLIIIENPEAHLYPGAQSRLVEFIISYAQQKKLQLILETHSDHIINGLRISVKNSMINKNDVSILFFDRNGRECICPQIRQIKVDKNGTLSDNPEDFMDEWTQQMLTLL